MFLFPSNMQMGTTHVQTFQASLDYATSVGFEPLPYCLDRDVLGWKLMQYPPRSFLWFSELMIHTAIFYKKRFKLMTHYVFN